MLDEKLVKKMHGPVELGPELGYYKIFDFILHFIYKKNLKRFFFVYFELKIILSASLSPSMYSIGFGFESTYLGTTPDVIVQHDGDMPTM